jgi:uncharacterized protein (TIRG00374 family)
LTRLRLALSIGISVALFAYLLWSVDRHQLAEQLRDTHWGWALLGAALAPAGLWTRARRWRYLFPPGPEPPKLVPAVMIGYMANNILPLRAGEVVRVYVVARWWHRGFWATLATLVVERVLDSLAIVLVLGALVLIVPVPAVFRWTAVTLLVVDLVAVATLAVLAGAPSRCAALVGFIVRRWPRLERHAARILETFLRGLDGVRTRAHALPLLGWTVVVWVVPALAAWIMLRAVNLDLPFTAGWAVLAFVGLGISIPSAPGYVGVFHYAAVLAVTMFGVPRPAAVGYAILFHASQIVPITLAGWVFLLREHMSLGEARRARPVEATDGAASR